MPTLPPILTPLKVAIPFTAVVVILSSASATKLPLPSSTKRSANCPNTPLGRISMVTVAFEPGPSVTVFERVSTTVTLGTEASGPLEVTEATEGRSLAAREGGLATGACPVTVTNPCPERFPDTADTRLPVEKLPPPPPPATAVLFQPPPAPPE